jgi:hypothetical protein
MGIERSTNSATVSPRAPLLDQPRSQAVGLAVELPIADALTRSHRRRCLGRPRRMHFDCLVHAAETRPGRWATSPLFEKHLLRIRQVSERTAGKTRFIGW